MSESFDGFDVIVTRQNAGSDLYGFGGGLAGAPPARPRPSGATPLRPGAESTRGAGGGVKAPAATICARSILAFGRFNRTMSSQLAPSAGAATRAPLIKRKVERRNDTDFITPPSGRDFTPCGGIRTYRARLDVSRMALHTSRR